MADEQGGAPSPATHQLMCAAILVMPLAYVAMAQVLRAVGVLPQRGFGDFDEGATLIVTGLFLAASVSASLLSPFLKKALLAKAAEAGDAPTPRHRFQAVFVAMALSEAGAVLGLVLMLMTGNMLYGALLCGLSFAITCFHFPGRHWLEHGDR